MAKKIIRNPTISINGKLPDELAGELALDELLDFIRLLEFKTALAVLFKPAGMKELFAALFDIIGIFGIAGIILFIF